MRRKLLQFETLENRLALAADPYLVKDIRTGSQTEGSYPEDFIQVGEQVFFTASTPQTGTELWKTDGTSAGTTLVKDINPFGDQSSAPKYLTNVNGTLFFSANDGASGTELWKSDGTHAGTMRVKNISFQRYQSSNLRNLTNVNGTLYFTTESTSFGSSRLWKSDGTESGTVEIDRGGGFYGPYDLVNFNGTLYFQSGRFGLGSMWRIDSTGNSVELFGQFSVSLRSTAVLDGQLYFSAFDQEHGVELWRTDGSVAGTVRIADIVPGSNDSNPDDFTVVGNQLYFTAVRPGENRQLWKTDGTAAGTVLLRAVNTDSYGGANPRELTNVNGRLYYAGSSEVGDDLWTSDGTTAGTRLVNNFDDVFGIGPSKLVNANGQLFFSMFDRAHGSEMWTSNGTSAGTQIFKEFKAGSGSGLQGISFVDGTMYLSADSGRGFELWKSDGTVAGTVLVGDLAKSSRNSLYRSDTAGLNVNGTLYFFNKDFSQYPSKVELWKTDGTTVGTELVKLLPRGSAPFTGINNTLTNVSGELYFVYRDRNLGYQLWKSDTTEAGTVPIANLSGRPRELINVSGKLFFENYQSSTGYELWRSDGTAAGTVLVKDISPGSRSTLPKHFTNFNGILYFTAETSAGMELWRSNGTAAGTFMLKDIWQGRYSAFNRYSDPEFTNINGVLYFVASDSSGPRIWKSGGTAATTVRVTNTGPIPQNLRPTNLTNVGGTLYFTAYDAATGFELWKTRGTVASTVQVRDIIAGAASSKPDELTNVDGVLYFTALEYAGGRELWRSDGTTNGTKRIIDILPGKESSIPHYLTNVQGKFYFAATSEDGTELWTSDGTLAGTRLVADLNQPGSTDPFNLTVLGSTLLFAADTVAFGTEWWGLETKSTADVTIIDNSSAGFSRTGAWTSLAQGRNGQAYVAAAGTGTAIASWNFTELAAGTYRIFATWTADDDRSTNLRYRVRETVSDTTNLLVKSISQRQAPQGLTDQGSIWSELGTVTITGRTLLVQLSNNTNTGRVIADAIRIERV